MRLTSFQVRGFKNLKQPVILGGLGPINVIHGPNNVGKSNVLQAIELFFRLVGVEVDGQMPRGQLVRLPERQLRELGIQRADIFNLESPLPITIIAEVAIDDDELAKAGISLPVTVRSLFVQLRLEWVGNDVAYNVQRFETDAVNASSYLTILYERAPQLARFLRYNAQIRTETADRFGMIGVERLSSESLALALFDAKESADLERARRWERFVEVMSSFKDLLGEGAFVVTYERQTGKAHLFYQTATVRIPLRLLGSGIQQIASMVGSLLMTNATLVALEEPELNLRYTLQERLREVLQTKLVGAPGGPSQLFITSHSPAFESGPHFYWMEPTPEGPRVEARGVEQARLAVGFPEEVVPPGQQAARCYLSTEGVVRVPERILQTLGLPQGGGVMFLEREGRVEMLSDERFARMLDGEPGGEGDEQS